MNQPESLTKAEKVALKAEKNTVVQIIRALAPMTPIVGGVIGGIDKLYEFWVKDIEAKNAAVYAQNIKQILDKIESMEEDKDWDLLIKHSFIKSLRCSKDGQIRKIVEILNGKYEGTIRSFNEAEDLINIVSELSENEAICLAEIYDVFEKMPTPTNPEEKKEIKNYGRESVLGISEDQREFLLNRLAGKGLIREKTGAFYDYEGGSFYPTAIGEKLFRVAPLFQE